MLNPDYRIDAISILLREDCILKGFYPLIPYRDVMWEALKLMGCERKSDVLRCTDDELLRAGLPDADMVGLFRRFLMMYDSKKQKMRDADLSSESPEEKRTFKELFLLPGIGSTRARLYMRAGFGLLEDIALATPERLIEACTLAISKDGLAVKPPLMKEARTHIAVAKAFCDVLDA